MYPVYHRKLGGGFKYCLFSPLCWGKIPILTSIFFKFRWFHHQPGKTSPRFSASRCFFGRAVDVSKAKKPVSEKQASATKDEFSRCFFLLQRRAYFRKKMDEQQKGRLSFFVLGVFALEGGEFATILKKG